MSATVFTQAREMAAIRTGTRRSQVVSAGVHAAVLLWLALHRQFAPAPEQLVEVTWLDPAPVASPAVEAPPAERVAAEVEPEPAPVSTPDSREVRFERPAEIAEQAPRPQDATVSRDAVRARLKELQPVREPNAALAAAAVPRRTLAAAPARNGQVATGGVDKLQRTSTPAPATTLTRNAAPARRPALAAAAPTSTALATAMPEATPTETAERILGSARLTGEVADRAVTSHEMPVYPEWATRQAVEADVTLAFVVLPDGRIKDGVQVTRTAGFLDFDDAAVAALRQWRFVPLPAGRSVEQHGSITFHFKLRDQR